MLLGTSMTFQKLKHLKQSQAGREKSGKRSNKKLTETESTSSSTIGGKDTSLFLFRVLGKVLYCKSEWFTDRVLGIRSQPFDYSFERLSDLSCNQTL